MVDPGAWLRPREHELSAESLDALFSNQIPAIRVEGFATPDECDRFAEAVVSAGLRAYSIEIPAFYVGVSQFEYRQGGDHKEEYFAEVGRVAPKLEEIFSASFDPLGRMIDLLARSSRRPVQVAAEEEFGEYCPVIIRHASGGLHLHSDFAPYNSPGWSIGRIDAQITWNLYVQVTEEGGETTLLNFPWMGGDERSSRGLPEDDLEERPEVERFTFRPVQGDVVLFNPRNPHKVAAGRTDGSSNRISIGSFVGRTQEGPLEIWG